MAVPTPELAKSQIATIVEGKSAKDESGKSKIYGEDFSTTQKPDAPQKNFDAYAMLRIAPTASNEEVRAAYKALTEESFTGTPTYLMFNPAGDLVAHVPGLIAVADVERYIAENGD